LDFIEACRKFISVDSTSQQSSKDIMELAASLCREKGLHVDLQEEIIGGQQEFNLLARPQPRSPTLEFLFQTHLDTVDPGPFQMWQQNRHNPFDAAIIDGKIYGIGTADVKLDFLCKLEAFGKYAKVEKWRLPPVLVGTFGEETGMLGALKLIRKNKISAKMALIAETSNLNLINAAKGFARVEIRLPFSKDEIAYRQEHNLRESTSTQSKIFHGQAAHSSTPHLGESAIAKMLDYLSQLPDSVTLMEIDGGTNYNTVPAHAFLEVDVTPVKQPMTKRLQVVYQAIKSLEKEFKDYHDPEFFPSHPTLSIGIIRTYEDHVFLSGSCRIPPNITQSVYEGWMRKLQSVCEAQASIFRVTDYKKPFRTMPNSILVKGCLDELRHLGLPHQCMTQPSSNEASIFSRVGIECVCFGPGVREGNIHTPNEHVAIDDLKKTISFYERVIERFCL
jgi:acetylornithine deacetylase/succinyl-diaminopimelate desuccinylase-like protein